LAGRRAGVISARRQSYIRSKSAMSKGTPGRDVAASPSAFAAWRRAVSRVATPTFFDKDVFTMPYQLPACPTLHSGQVVDGRIEAGPTMKDVSPRLFTSVYGECDQLKQIFDGWREVILSWRIPDTGGYPIFEIGLELAARGPQALDGTVYLDYLTWAGAPETRLYRPDDNLSTMWKHAWVNNACQFQTRWEGLRDSNGEGIGFISQGSQDWRDHRVRSDITPLLAKGWGLAARLQGRERYILCADVRRCRRRAGQARQAQSR
jgi:hypothetical protein